MTSQTKVIVVGAGVVGPVLATFLKIKGYHPVLYERTSELSSRGIGHGVAPNGLRVLEKIPGLLESMEFSALEKFISLSTVEEDKRILTDVSLDAALGGARLIGVRRAALQKAVVDAATQNGVEIKWGHKLISLEQHEDSVTVKFDNGAQDTASFAVGCDGLHSNTRSCLFGEEKADFTGMVQIGGICPTPEVFLGTPAGRNYFGNGAHLISLPVSSTHSAWAATQRGSEATKETWNAVDNRVAEEIRSSPMAQWAFGAGDFIKNTEKFVKYGLYDRPELKTWHQSRVLLIGDAAHPTSPHLGQGANQSFEDADLLVTLLEKHNPSAGALSTTALDAIFTELEAERIPRSAMQVKEARKAGENRVVDGVEACVKRNNEHAATWGNQYRRIFAWAK